ncbi:hypothetical protein CDAR_211111 [Caerostris darwini]|uniref:Uncharacterized protein n=1 Tax=Caerostris darwini TaxID=1538125 RepID=A0AAV4M909_9ARAC|nr:hypothetical protein CDAR_211111 [Caerostris darwini]
MKYRFVLHGVRLAGAISKPEEPLWLIATWTGKSMSQLINRVQEYLTHTFTISLSELLCSFLEIYKGSRISSRLTVLRSPCSGARAFLVNRDNQSFYIIFSHHHLSISTILFLSHFSSLAGTSI